MARLNAISRRRTLALMAACGTSGMAAPSWGQPRDLRVLMLSDLHSAYSRMPALLEAMRRVVRRDRSPSLILLNGDMFEHGNVVALRTEGALDWAFIEALTRLAPVVLNLGNHEADLVNDQNKTIARARALGVTVLSDIIDARTGEPAAAAQATLHLPFPVQVMGLATNALDTYPAAIRPTLDIPAPVAFAAAHLPQRPLRHGQLIVMSHAGLPADKLILPHLPDGTLFLGGHDHLILDARQGRTRYVHTGSWGAILTVATIVAGRIAIERLTIDPAGPADPDLSALTAATLRRTLTSAETAVVARSPQALSLGDTGRALSVLMAKAAGADVGFIGHTTLGMGLPSGEVTQYDFDAIVRFDGAIMRAEVDAAALTGMLTLANQDADLPLARRSGDFVYGAPLMPSGAARHSVVTTDWCAVHQKTYFGRDDLKFAEVPGMKVKATLRDALGRL